MLGGLKIALFFTLFILLHYLSPRPDTKGSMGLMKAHLPKNEICYDWLAVPVRCDWRTA